SDRLPDHMPSHCRTFGIVQRAAIGLSDWRAGGRNNYGLGHAILQFASGRAAFVARSAGGVSIVLRTPIQTHPQPSERLRGDARQHQAFAAKLTPGGGLLESGTKKSGNSGWLGSTR